MLKSNDATRNATGLLFTITHSLGSVIQERWRNRYVVGMKCNTAARGNVSSWNRGAWRKQFKCPHGQLKLIDLCSLEIERAAVVTLYLHFSNLDQT